MSGEWYKLVMKVDHLAKCSKNIRGLVKLSKHGDWKIRCNVARNPSTPPEVLVELSKDKDWWVLLRVICNPNTPPEVLREMYNSNPEEFRSFVVRNPKCPVEILLVGE